MLSTGTAWTIFVRPDGLDATGFGAAACEEAGTEATGAADDGWLATPAAAGGEAGVLGADAGWPQPARSSSAAAQANCLGIERDPISTHVECGALRRNEGEPCARISCSGRLWRPL